MNQTENITNLIGTKAQVIGEFPCSQAQLRFWVLDQLEAGNPALNVAERWEIRGSFKASTLEAAFRRIIQRHEILRTRFVERRGIPYQQVLDTIDFKMSVIDLRNVPIDQREERILSIGEETACARFDLAQGDLFRVTLMIVENNRAFILVTAHHTCFDGWSIRILGRELGEIASAIDAGRTVDLPELPLQYGDYALWQEEFLSRYSFETETAFWKRLLLGAPYFEVPSDHQRPLTRSASSDVISVVKALEFGERIERAARDHRVSLYAYGVAVISTALHRFTGETDIMFDTQIAGREQTDLEPMIGVFINNLVIRLAVRPGSSFDEHIRVATEAVTAALNHQRMPFNKVVELVNPVRDPSRNPLISVNFNLSKAFLEDHNYGGFELISAPSQTSGAIYDISFSMVWRPSGWRMSIEYNTDLFDKSTVDRMLQLWQDVYEQALGSSSAPLVPDTSSLTSMNSEATGFPAIPISALHAPAATPAALSAAERIARMGEIWADVLDQPQVEPDGNFFALGGHSLAALRMLSIARDSFGIKPDLALLLREPTLKEFTQSLFGGQAAALSAPAASPSNSWKTNTYKTGTASGSVYTLNHPFLYYPLANVLDDKVSVYNVNMFGATVEETSSAVSFEDIAAEAVEAMQIDARNGPIALVGLCVNGVLAVEIARQLREANVDVTCIAIIDSWAPAYSRGVPQLGRRLWSIERRVRRVNYFVGKLLSGRMKLVAFLREFNVTLWLMGIFGVGAAKLTADESANARVTDYLMRAARDYASRPSGELLLFRSQANPRRAKRLLFGWERAIAGNAGVVDLEGWHEDSLTDKGMCTLARSIEDAIMLERL
ncbi:condensation domain-containing protein [Rhizobium sp. CECT 9324]|uniref:condensation domain-containing protein n=1 Tax=Rhizobium sp. CECT 9324 TaxID=2845820 RepID=UPI001E4C1834|nr:condensation domain-containing protein [Rhizobium sp. CECT 9324]CAH0342916.1 hypothetical protein RHI9324_04648 [Rhizobium sp. CECT 9324]